MTRNKKSNYVLYNDKLKKMMIAISKKKHTTTTKYLEEALQNQINKDMCLLEKEDLIAILKK